MLAMVATVADATVYVGSRTLGGATVNLSVTTDGTLGILAAANVTSWNIAVTAPSPANSYTYMPGNSVLIVTGIALSATASTLTYNFGLASGSKFLVYEFPIPASTTVHYYCLQTAQACVPQGGSDEIRSQIGAPSSRYVEAREGLAVLGTVALDNNGVPEPASWAMMFAGFSVTGFALRRRQKAALRYAF